MENNVHNDEVRSNRNVILWVVSFAFAHIGLVWLIPYFPTTDGPSHLYNVVILRDLLNGGREWGKFFAFKFEVIGNLGFHIIAYPLLNFFSPLVVEKVFLSIYAILLTVSVLIFSRTFGHDYLPSSLFVLPIIFNYSFVMGFYSYSIAVSLFILGFCLFWRIRKRPVFFKFIVTGFTGIVLYIFHIIPFCLFLISVLVISVIDSNYERKNILFFLELLLIMSPLILIAVHFLLSSGTSISPSSHEKLISLWWYKRLIKDFFFFSTVNYSDWQKLPGILFLLIIALYAVQPAKILFDRVFRSGNITPPEMTLFCFILVMLLIYLFAPNEIGHGGLLNERLPWVILIFSLPLLRLADTNNLKKFETIIIAAVVSVSFLFNAFFMYKESEKIQLFLSGLNVPLQKGAIVMTFRKRPRGWSKVDPLLHAVSYYGIEKGCVDIGNFEVTRNTFFTRFKSDFPPVPTVIQAEKFPETIQWSQFPSIQYVFGWEMADGDREKLQKYYKLIWQENHLSIWERRVADL